MVRAMEAHARTGKVPKGLGLDANQIAALRATMFGAERSRTPAAPVFGEMSKDLMKAGHAPATVLGTSPAGGLHPLSPEGVNKDVKKLEGHLSGNRKEEAPTGAKRQAEREIALLKAWIKTQEGLVFDDKASKKAKLEALKAEITRRMTSRA